jgi:tetratricopeptide (TPR) repeat protein
MAFLYLGIIYYNHGDFENARAAFNKALLADKQSEEGYREDLRLIFFLLAKTYLKLGDQENAKVAMRKAGERLPGEPYPANPFYDLEKARRANVTFVVELGEAPEKFRHGPGASLDAFARRSYPERRARLFWGDEPLGETALALDLFYEAAHRGTSGKDVVQGVKGVTRDAAVATAVLAKDERVKVGALLFALANQSQADIRQWDLLPGELQTFSARVAPGLHTLTLEFLGDGGLPLSSYRQVWYYVPAYPDREQIYLFRSGRHKGDGSYLIYQPKETS